MKGRKFQFFGKKAISMKTVFRITFILVFITCLTSCLEKDYDIEYQDDYPNKLNGNWVVFEFPGGGGLEMYYMLLMTL